MNKVEVLSPAGDLENFFTAINSGADAVYLGLDRFNARMKADNISTGNISEVVDFAHLKGVKVYVTLNTLVSDSEMKDVIQMVDECVRAGVDAFIVQDFGIIGVLRRTFPSIVLHGSTQLGVHNLRGARVAKSLGLSRVVLSREVTLEDIRQISQNVDIELEVFVQGAMCVCFSGNCYLSSLKCGASGNRGECKQLCRLPYKLSGKDFGRDGYMLSPRDNCMLDSLKDIVDAGVVSLKIEGRLRRQGYVSVATRVYRNAIDELILTGYIDDVHTKKNALKKVFSRGEFVQGYFDGNDIIDSYHNNHMGEYIGEVVSCSRFKNIYRIELKVNVQLHKNDGLKLVDKNSSVSLGVGNIEYNGNNIVVFAKNYAKPNSKVYRVLDSVFEGLGEDISRYERIDMYFEAYAGSPMKLKIVSPTSEYALNGDMCEIANTKGTTLISVQSQLEKLGDYKKYFRLGDITCDIGDNVFLPIAKLNSLRRDCLEGLKNMILSQRKLPYKRNVTMALGIEGFECHDIALAMVDEKMDISNIRKEYDGIILSPTVYSLDVVAKFCDKVSKVGCKKVLLNMPIIALKEDLVILDKVVEFCRERGIGLVANNIYALDYISEGSEVWAGSNMNITNQYSAILLKKYGVEECISAIEKWFGSVGGTIKMCNGYRVLMTLAHCPHKTLTRRDCANGQCGYLGDLVLLGENRKYTIRRYKVASCYFELVDSVLEEKDSDRKVDDLRGIKNV